MLLFYIINFLSTISKKAEILESFYPLKISMNWRRRRLWKILGSATIYGNRKIVQRGTLWVGRGSNPWEGASPPPPPPPLNHPLFWGKAYAKKRKILATIFQKLSEHGIFDLVFFKPFSRPKKRVVKFFDKLLNILLPEKTLNPPLLSSPTEGGALN